MGAPWSKPPSPNPPGPPNPPGALKERPCPTVPCRRNESDDEPAPEVEAAPGCRPAPPGTDVSSFWPLAPPSPVTSVCWKPPLAIPACTAFKMPGGSWPRPPFLPRPPGAFAPGALAEPACPLWPPPCGPAAPFAGGPAAPLAAGPPGLRPADLAGDSVGAASSARVATRKTSSTGLVGVAET